MSEVDDEAVEKKDEDYSSGDVNGENVHDMLASEGMYLSGSDNASNLSQEELAWEWMDMQCSGVDEHPTSGPGRVWESFVTEPLEWLGSWFD